MAIPGWKDLIICGQTSGEYTNPCGFNDLMILAKNIINDLVVLSSFIVLFMAVYVGFKLLTSGGNEGAMKKAKDVGMKVIIGYLWILGAWLLVYTVASVLLKSQYLFLLGKPQ